APRDHDIVEEVLVRCITTAEQYHPAVSTVIQQMLQCTAAIGHPQLQQGVLLRRQATHKAHHYGWTLCTFLPQLDTPECVVPGRAHLLPAGSPSVEGIAGPGEETARTRAAQGRMVIITTVEDAGQAPLPLCFQE